MVPKAVSIMLRKTEQQAARVGAERSHGKHRQEAKNVEVESGTRLLTPLALSHILPPARLPS